MSAALTFMNGDLKALLANADVQWPLGVRTLYDDVTGPGFWLVGDQGVYLMHNGTVAGDKPVVVYAVECNPDTLDFDEWWATKRATFGGDDGVEFIAEESLRHVIERGDDIVIEFEGDQMAILTIERKPLQ